LDFDLSIIFLRRGRGKVYWLNQNRKEPNWLE